jgi:hypothetical protein
LLPLALERRYPLHPRHLRRARNDDLFIVR